MRRSRFASGFDAASVALILGGAALIAASIVAAVLLITPPRPTAPSVAEPPPTPLITGRTSAALPPDRVATVLTLDAAAGAAGAARIGDHIDVLGFFSRQSSGTDPVTRVLLADVPVLSVDRSGNSVSLTLAVPQESALLLHEAQSLGAQPLVALRPLHAAGEPSVSFSDTDLANRLSTGSH